MIGEGLPLAAGSFGGTVPAPVIAPVLPPLTSLEVERYYSYLGPLKKYLDDPGVRNIHLNANGTIFVEKAGVGKFKAEETTTAKFRSSLICYIAGRQYGRVMDSLHSRLQAELPIYGCRVQAFAPPIVEGWAAIIRVPDKSSIDLNSYRPQVHLGKKSRNRKIRPLAEDPIDAMFEAIASGANCVTVGPVNSGKSRLLNSMLNAKSKVHPNYRAVVIQDRQEVFADGFEDRLEIMARVTQAHHESNGVVTRYTYEFTDALEDALRSNGDFLVQNEVRDERSMFGLIMAVNTGTDGLMTTMHSNTLDEMQERMEALCALYGVGSVSPSMIASLFNLYAFMDYDPQTRDRALADLRWQDGINAHGRFTLTRIGMPRDQIDTGIPFNKPEQEIA